MQIKTLPSDVMQVESCSYDQSEQDMGMKENRKTVVYSHENLRKDSSPLSDQLCDEHTGDTFPRFIDLKVGDASWNPFLTDFSIENENGSRDSSVTEYPNGISHEPSVENDKDLSFAVSDRDNKEVVECETHDSIVILKDICVDEVGYLKDRVFFESNNDDRLSSIVSDQMVDASFLSSKAEDDKSNGYIDGELCDQGSRKTELGSFFGQDISEFYDAVESLQDNESNTEPAAKKLSDVPEKNPFLFSSLDSDEAEVPKYPDQLKFSEPEVLMATPDMSASFADSGSDGTMIRGTLRDQLDKEKNSDENKKGETVAVSFPNNENENSHNDPVLNRDKTDVRESSFSKAASLITYSGPVTHAGSLSVRSDGSATSGRSFAFPILQSEWNCSPVRMAKADGRRFRKHGGWKTGIFCCRF